MTAIVELHLGDKITNRFIRAAGLGIENVFEKKRMIMSYKPDSVVTHESVTATLQQMQRECQNDETLPFEIVSFEIISIQQ